MRGILALEDGFVLEGEAFASSGTTTGEVCFNTSMTGYQEVVTDPSYCGQLVAMTHPHIGNYGANEEDAESDRPWVRALIVEELARHKSSWRASMTLDEYLAKWNVLGLQHVDTRALTRRLRTQGAMRGCLTTELTLAEALEQARSGTGVVGMDFAKEVTCAQAYDWDPEDIQSQEWTLPSTNDIVRIANPLPGIHHRIAVMDYGVKKNILRRLRQAGFQCRVFPATSSSQEILEMNPDGVFLSNGPGDPAALTYAHQTLKELIGKKPVFGICLGHQLLAYAMGGETFKLKFGHRGGNQPVQDLQSKLVSITSQNHGFAVDPESLPADMEVTHLNLNDQTVEGMRHKELPVASVQYHPEAAPGPHDARYFFGEFAKMVAECK
ncbi:MAG: glutamine-hydrolyzing carbamoyl-phosphate synthase small subunit [Verrucomicrobiales bacterium]